MGKGEIKLSLFANNIIIHVENPNGQRIPRSNNSKIAGYKVKFCRIQMNFFPYANNEQVEFKMKKYHVY